MAKPFKGTYISEMSPSPSVAAAPTIPLRGRLHGIDDIALFNQLQADAITQQVPVIALTSRVMPWEIAQYRRLRMAGVVAKPFEPETLDTEIAQLLH